MQQDDTPLLHTLQKLVYQQDIPFYCPGHKHGQSVTKELRELLGNQLFLADLPELPELDNLFNPQGVIQSAQLLASQLYHAKETFFLVNGSTAGILASLLSVCQEGDKVLIPRNAHQSVFSALILSGVIPVYLSPEYDDRWDLCYSVSLETLKEALAIHPDSKAVVLLYPTYQGVGGDMEGLIRLCHQYNVPVIVDEAHGAHFGFHPRLPPSSLSWGADLVVQSAHKTLSALTQGSWLHLQGDRVSSHKVRRALQWVQTTSPSYVILASLDYARYQMATQGLELLEQTLQLADFACQELRKVTGVEVFSPDHVCWFDRTRLTLKVSGLGISGYDADEKLREWGIVAELPSLQHLTFILSIGNRRKDIEGLIQGIQRLSQWSNLSVDGFPTVPFNQFYPAFTLATLSPRQVAYCTTKRVLIDHAVDRISAETLSPYPPGIPIIISGEVIKLSQIQAIQQIIMFGGTITGCSDPTLETLQVVA